MISVLEARIQVPTPMGVLQTGQLRGCLRTALSASPGVRQGDGEELASGEDPSDVRGADVGVDDGIPTNSGADSAGSRL